MVRTIQEIMQAAGRPRRLYIYQSADQTWRFSLYHINEVADGKLKIPAGASLVEARLAAEKHVNEVSQKFYQAVSRVEWDKNDAKCGVIALDDVS